MVSADQLEYFRGSRYEISIDQAKQVYEQQRSFLKTIGYYDAVKDALAAMLKQEPSMPRPTKAVCVALMHVAFYKENELMSTRGATQLAVFEAILAGLGIPHCDAIVYDPVFNDTDRRLLKELGYQAPEHAFGSEEQPSFPVLEATTLIFHPGCNIDHLYRQNWSVEGLSKIVDLDGCLNALNCIYGDNAEVNGKECLTLLSGSTAAKFEPIKRAALLSERRNLPVFHSFHHTGTEDCKVAGGICNKYDRRVCGYLIDRSLSHIRWFPVGRLRAMGTQYWQVNELQERVGAGETRKFNVPE